MKNKLGLIALVAASLIWGIAFIPTRTLGQNGISIFFELLIRYTIPTILILLLKQKVIFSSSKKTILSGIVMGVILFIALSFSIYGIQNITHGSMGMLMMSLYIVLVPLASFVITKHKISPIMILAIIFASIGSMMLSWGNGQFMLDKGTIFCALASITYTIYILLGSKILHGNADAFVIQFYQSIAVIVLCIPFLMITAPDFASKIPMILATPAILYSILYIGIFAGTIGYMLYFFGQKESDPVIVPIVLSLQSLFATIADMFIFKIELAPLQIIAYILLLLSFFVGSCDAYLQTKFKK
ncbi:MAG: DMT family transporter [Brevinema sp.]